MASNEIGVVLVLVTNQLSCERLIRAGKVRTSYWSPQDKSLARWISYQVNQRNYRKQYAACFGHRGIDD